LFVSAFNRYGRHRGEGAELPLGLAGTIGERHKRTQADGNGRLGMSERAVSTAQGAGRSTEATESASEVSVSASEATVITA
jgi:hypothetical protein